MYIDYTIDELVSKIKKDANKLAQIFHPIFVLQKHTWGFTDGLKVPTINQLEEMIIDLVDELSEDNLESECGGINIRLRYTKDFVNKFYVGELSYVPSYDSFD